MIIEFTRRVFFRVNNALHFGDTETMNQRLKTQICVDQCRNDTEFPQAEPNRDVLGPVGHHQSHGVSFHVASLLKDARYLVAVFVNLKVYQRADRVRKK